MTRLAGFHEATAQRRLQAVPLAHVSIEVGHFYSEDYAAGREQLRRAFQRVAPWVEAAQRIDVAAAGKAPRVSTCFLVDDYHSTIGPPAQVLPELLAAAQDCGLAIDYLVRESGCVEADGVPLARLVEERIVADPPPDTTGVRPPVTETGWLCNGQRTPGPNPAMDLPVAWHPPAENAARRHSIFVDVELWNQDRGARTWSCAYLAGVWQLLRLGLLRSHGASVAVPRLYRTGELPEEWDQLPAVIQLNPQAAPFSAYRSRSVLASRFLPTEQAVRTLLSQVAVDAEVAQQVLERGQAEGIALPIEPVDRVEYVFIGG